MSIMIGCIFINLGFDQISVRDRVVSTYRITELFYAWDKHDSDTSSIFKPEKNQLILMMKPVELKKTLSSY